MLKIKYSVFVLILVIAGFVLNGCVNYEQDTKLNSDGSGTMAVHYWTNMSNFSMGNKVGNFDFDEEAAKSNYTSSNTEVTNITIDDNLTDSTKHVRIDIKFNDINELNRAKGFQSTNVSWKESSDGMELKYMLMKDSAAANNPTSSENTITYTFEMPSDIVSTNATRKDGNKLTWEYKLSDLKQDVEMTANVKKSGGKLCGIIGFVLSFSIIGLAYTIKRRK